MKMTVKGLNGKLQKMKIKKKKNDNSVVEKSLHLKKRKMKKYETQEEYSLKMSSKYNGAGKEEERLKLKCNIGDHGLINWFPQHLLSKFVIPKVFTRLFW